MTRNKDELYCQWRVKCQNRTHVNSYYCEYHTLIEDNTDTDIINSSEDYRD